MKRITVLLVAAALIGGAGTADAKHRLHQHKDNPTKISQHKDNPTKKHKLWYRFWHGNS
jgi:hypothetical protein